jgi:putative ABC transport system permease protein
MGKSSDIFMPESKARELVNIAGVDAVSPQVFLKTLYGAPCCSASEMFLVAFDPVSDFTLRPWLDKQLDRELGRGEVIGGSYISADAADHLRLYGYQVTLVGNLEASGTGIDQSLFMTLETAQDIARSSLTTAESPLEVPSGEISTIMVKTSPKADPHLVALEIASKVKDVVPVESPSMFGAFRQQVAGLMQGFMYIEVFFLFLSSILAGIFFTIVINERRREVAVLRALGADRRFIFLSIISEAATLALSGALLGIAVASFATALFGGFITSSLGIPFLFPDLSSWLLLVGVGTALILTTVTLAAVIPAYRMSRQEPALAARE